MRFDELDLERELLDGLDAMNFEEMTPIQEETIPVILSGKDIIACAQTGTGKTAAFVLPLLNQLTKEENSKNKIRAIIMAPTRELAQQIDIQIQGFSYFLSISSLLVYGGGDGVDWEQQKRGMKLGADIIVATPGRLLSHIEHSKVDLSHVTHFILDEADRMLDMGFSDDIIKISKQLPHTRQTILFSATMPPKIRQLIKSTLHEPVEVNVAVSKPNESIRQYVYLCYEGQKMGIIQSIFSQKREGKSVLFCSSKQKVKELTHLLKRSKLKVAAMHSDLEQEERQQVMLDFDNNKLDLLVATDIIARGIDVNDIGLVINFDVPHDSEDYIHRIGRTGRADANGEAITLVNIDDQQRLLKIEQFIEKEIERLPMPEGLGESPEFTASFSRGRRKGPSSGPNSNQRGRRDNHSGHSNERRQKPDTNRGHAKPVHHSGNPTQTENRPVENRIPKTLVKKTPNT
ncbi:MAG: DEAD/DEAH box helicase [Bacteroidales bacterium]